jgi:hypothetical protein
VTAYAAQDEGDDREQPDDHPENHQTAPNLAEDGALGALVLFSSDLHHLSATHVMAEVLQQTTPSRQASGPHNLSVGQESQRTFGRITDPVAIVAWTRASASEKKARRGLITIFISISMSGGKRVERRRLLSVYLQARSPCDWSL